MTIDDGARERAKKFAEQLLADGIDILAALASTGEGQQSALELGLYIPAKYRNNAEYCKGFEAGARWKEERSLRANLTGSGTDSSYISNQPAASPAKREAEPYMHNGIDLRAVRDNASRIVEAIELALAATKPKGEGGKP